MQISTVSVSDLSSACAEVWNVLHLFVLRDFTLLLSFSCFLFGIWDLNPPPLLFPFPIWDLGLPSISLYLGRPPFPFLVPNLGFSPSCSIASVLSFLRKYPALQWKDLCHVYLHESFGDFDRISCPGLKQIISNWARRCLPSIWCSISRQDFLIPAFTFHLVTARIWYFPNATKWSQNVINSIPTFFFFKIK